jgi:hypothetical protein
LPATIIIVDTQINKQEEPMTVITLVPKKTISAVLLVVSLLFLSSSPALAQSSTTVGATGDFLDTFATAEFPGAYGDILDYLAKKAEGAPDPVKVIYEDLDKYNKWVGRISAGVDILGKAGIGEYSEAAISAAMLGITEYAGSEAGKAMLAVVGLSTVSVNVAIAAVQVYRASVAELEKQTIGRQLESLYGKIESDPVLKNRNRTLGQGDPIPVNQANIDYMWKKVMADTGTWRELFKVYVTNELQKDWPEPSTWEKWTLSSDLLEEDLLLKQKDEYKSYIAGLLSQLNRTAKVGEQQVLARQALLELQRKAGSLPDLATMLGKFNEARKRLPAAAELGNKCATYVQNAINIKSINSLEDLMSQCKGFAENVLRYIPEKGTYAAERKRIFDQLKKCYELAKSNVPQVAALQKQDLEKKAQSVPTPSGGYRYDAQRFPFTLEFSQVKDQVLAAFQKGQPELDKLIEGMSREYYDKSVAKYDELQNRTNADYRKTREPLYRIVFLGSILEANEAQDKVNGLDAAYKSFTEKMDAYRAIDSTALNSLMFQVNEYVDTLGRVARLDAEKTNPRPIWDKINTAKGKKDAVLQAVAGIEKLPADTGYAGLLKLTFPKPGSAEYGAKPYLAPYLDYVNKLALNVRYRVTYYEGGGSSYGGEGRVGEVNGLIQQIDATIGSIDESGKLNADVKEIEDSITGFRNTVKTAMLRQDDKTRLEKEVQGMDASVKELKDFLGKTSGYRSMCTTKRTKYLTDINNIETDMGYLAQLKIMLEKTGDILDGLGNKYRREPAGSYGVGAGGFVFKENTGTGCEALLTKPSIMSKAEADKAVSSTIAEVERTGIFKTDKTYNMGIEQYAKKLATDYFAYGTLTPEHYIFVQIPGGLCFFYTKDHFEDLASKINALPVEWSDAALKGKLDGIASDSMVARFLVGLNPSNSLDKINTKGLLDVADRSWDGDVKQSIRKFVNAINGKVDAFRHYAVVEAQMNALLAKLMAVESPAQGKTDAALWKKVTDMEPEILAFEKSVVADSVLTAENKTSLKASIDSMKSRISMAKMQPQIIKGPMTTGGQMVPGQTGGAAGPGGMMPGTQGAGPTGAQGGMPAGAPQTPTGGAMAGPIAGQTSGGQQMAGGMPQMAAGSGPQGGGGPVQPPAGMSQATAPQASSPAPMAAGPQASGQSGGQAGTGPMTGTLQMPTQPGGGPGSGAPSGMSGQPAGAPMPGGQQSGPGPMAAAPGGAAGVQPQMSAQSGGPTAAMPQMPGGQPGTPSQPPSGVPSGGAPTAPTQPQASGPMAGASGGPQMPSGGPGTGAQPGSQMPAGQIFGQPSGGIGSMAGGALSQGIQTPQQGGGTMGYPSQQPSGQMAGAGSTPIGGTQTRSPMQMPSAGGQTGGPPSQAPQAAGPMMASMPAAPPKQAAQSVDYTPKIKDLYSEFGRAFNGKDLTGVTGCLSRDWQANDGTSLATLKTGLEKAFKTFDEVKLNVQNLKIEKSADGKYKATYSATVSGLIRKTNTKPEERSNVSDEVSIDQAGKPRIAKTLAGRFWPKQ